MTHSTLCQRTTQNPSDATGAGAAVTVATAWMGPSAGTGSQVVASRGCGAQGSLDRNGTLLAWGAASGGML